MREMFDRIWVGGLDDCVPGTDRRVVIHACKDPCHRRRVGYTRPLPPTHDHYLAVEDARDLFLNLIDPPIPLFKIESFLAAMAFVETHAAREILIHCNKGDSRAPTLAVLVARWRRLYPLETWEEATALMPRQDERFRPGRGLDTFMAEHWKTLGAPPPQERGELRPL